MTKEPRRAPDVPAVPAASNADKARALMALLESGGGAGAEGIPAARLRDWARDLVETVERAAVPAPKPEEKAEARPEARVEPRLEAKPDLKPEPRLTASRPALPHFFTKAPPVLVDRGEPAPAAPAVPPLAAFAPPPAAVPRPAMAPVAPPAAAYSEVARPPASRMTLGAPMPHAPPRPQATVGTCPPVLSRQEVDRLVASTLDPHGDPAVLAREHPAIVALTLLGKQTLQQAAVLRGLPGGQMRAVHRALRQLEARQA